MFEIINSDLVHVAERSEDLREIDTHVTSNIIIILFVKIIS